MSNISPLQVNHKNVASPPYTLADAALDDLAAINAVITSAVYSWPIAQRLKRLSLPVLHYTQTDLDNYKVIVARNGATVIATAAWDNSNVYRGPGNLSCALLHGLYVDMNHQGQGLGRLLQTAVIQQAGRHGFAGLVVKAQRVSRSYFAQQGYEHTTEFSDDYPYLYWQAFTR